MPEHTNWNMEPEFEISLMCGYRRSERASARNKAAAAGKARTRVQVGVDSG